MQDMMAVVIPLRIEVAGKVTRPVVIILQHQMNVAVVDSGGNLVAFQRMDGAQLASIQISEHKARAAVTFRRETRVFENAVQQSNFNYVMTVDGVVASRGGIPLVEDGKLIGAIGCSGGTGSQDEVACKVGAATVK